jgi:hypothetical protein
MAYRNKLYIAFDGDEDMEYYRLLQAWSANRSIDFDFYNAHDLNTARDSSLTDSIKAQLRERMDNSKAMLLLVGEKTHRLKKFLPYEVKIARKRDVPIIVANLNGKRKYDKKLCPAAVEDGVRTVHIAFEQKAIRHALKNFPDWYHANKNKSKYQDHTLSYPDSIYE